jgi:hypothetical protein
MAALTADSQATKQVALALGGLGIPVAASTKLYAGGMVAVNASGYAVACSDAANLEFMGFCEAGVDNSGGNNGDKVCQLTTRASNKLGVVELDAVSPQQSWVGQVLAFTDDHTVALMASTAHVLRAGRCIFIQKTGTSGRVWIDTNETGSATAFSS